MSPGWQQQATSQEDTLAETRRVLICRRYLDDPGAKRLDMHAFSNQVVFLKRTLQLRTGECGLYQQLLLKTYLRERLISPAR